MITQRQIRIRAMQAIYSYHLRLRVNYQLSLEFLEDKLRPGYLKNDIPTEELIHEKIKACIPLFEKCYSEGFPANCFKDSHEEKKLFETHKYLSDLNKEDLENVKQQITDSFDLFEKCYLTYFSVFVDMAVYVENAHGNKNSSLQTYFKNKRTIELVEKCRKMIKNKKWIPYYRKDNGFIEELITIDILKNFQKENFNGTEILSENKKSESTFLITDILFNSAILEDYFENYNLFWNDDSPLVKHWVYQTLTNVNKRDNNAIKTVLIPSEKETKTFFNHLVEKTIHNEKKYLPWLSEKAKNWEVARMQEVDKILILMAICELLEFKNIPPKVTIDEYIEIAKYYCSPKSRQFVNGILDGIFKELMKEGKIKKSGKGLKTSPQPLSQKGEGLG